MNRRDLIATLASRALALKGVEAVTLSTPVVLQPAAVMANAEIYNRGEGVKFQMTLLKKPWPIVGDDVTLEFDGIRIAGTVTEFSTEGIRGSDRVFYHIRGDVTSWDAKSAKDE